MPGFTEFIIQSGVPKEVIILVLMLPIIATFVALAREILGIHGFGVYTSTIIAFAFVATGLYYGILLFGVTLATGTLIRLLIKQVRLLYLPRMAIVLTGVSLAIFLLFFEAAFSKRTPFITSAGSFIFPSIMMITLIENFVSAQIDRGAKRAITLTIETLALAIISFFIITFGPLRMVILAWPFGVFIGAVLINMLIGKWTGLRVTEYIRFRDLIKYTEAVSKNK